MNASMSASLHNLAIQAIATIHSALNQPQLPIRTKLELIIDNTKYLLAISSALLEEEKIKELKSDLEKAEKALLNFEKVELDENEQTITTYSEMQAKIERKIKEREKYIIDTCLEIVSEIINATKGQIFWQ
ncbi:hypothetical protein ACPB8Q_04980 [Methanocaldococcus indicus]|uniref:hypothetical protein n=1 Tax=Methanocaldococcus indicus TaxID=213231 RepID=UPI003C6D3FA3